MTKKRMPWLLSLWLLAAASHLMAQQPKSAQSAKPNIVVIMGDDIGMWNIGAHHRCALWSPESAKAFDLCLLTVPSRRKS